VTFRINDQLYGIPILQVQDVLSARDISRIPLAPRMIAGSLNLRGRIVTTVDLRLRLGLSGFENPQRQMSIVVELQGELYSLLIDEIGKVVKLFDKDLQRNPATMKHSIRDISAGVFSDEEELMVVVVLDALLEFTKVTMH
jgi:purine-binding chemotaxis protein CheW